MTKQDETKVVDTFVSEIDANIVRGMLEANGITAGVLGDSVAGGILRGFSVGTWRLVVLAKDYDDAMALINAQPDANDGHIVYRKASAEDADDIWRILSGEIEVMRKAGRKQWQSGYPNPEAVAEDINIGRGRVLVVDGQIVAYCALVYTGEPNYDVLLEGAWLTGSNSSDPTYSVVHRVATDPAQTGKGYGSQIIEYAIDESAKDGFESMRMDTNYDNVQMLHILPNLGFTHCGVVKWSDGTRNIFERYL